MKYIDKYSLNYETIEEFILPDNLNKVDSYGIYRCNLRELNFPKKTVMPVK